MSALSQFDAALQLVSGAIGAEWGQGFDVYRLGPQSTGTGVVSPQNRVATNVGIVFEKMPPTKAEINLMTKIPLFRADLDIRNYRVGDVFVERSDTLRADLSVFTLASMRPNHDPIFVFTPIYGTVRRPNRDPLGVDSGIAPMQTQTAESDYILALDGGTFSFEPSEDPPVTVPMCIQGNERKGEYSPRETGLFDDVRMQQWDIYVPLYPGLMIVENDVIVGANGDKFRVHLPFPQFAGFQGQLLRAEKRRN